MLNTTQLIGFGSGHTGYRYWRLRMMSTVAGSGVNVPILHLRAYVGGPTLCTGGTAIESSHSGTDEAAGAFVDTRYPLWIAGGKVAGVEWLGYVFPEPVEIREISWWGEGWTFSPEDFNLEYSVDGVTWLLRQSYTYFGWEDDYGTSSPSVFLVTE